MLQRYCQLGLPYLAIVLLILPIYEFARGWVPDDVLGQPVSLAQFLAHLFFLQDILGWKPCQPDCGSLHQFPARFGYAFGMMLQQRFGRGGDSLFAVLGWGTSIYSLFHFSLDRAAIAGRCTFPVFLHGHPGFKALVRRSQGELAAFQCLLVLFAVLYDEWRWRLVIAMLFGTLLFVAERSGLVSALAAQPSGFPVSGKFPSASSWCISRCWYWSAPCGRGWVGIRRHWRWAACWPLSSPAWPAPGFSIVGWKPGCLVVQAFSVRRGGPMKAGQAVSGWFSSTDNERVLLHNRFCYRAEETVPAARPLGSPHNKRKE